jgi:hypothetical protein
MWPVLNGVVVTNVPLGGSGLADSGRKSEQHTFSTSAGKTIQI